MGGAREAIEAILSGSPVEAAIDEAIPKHSKEKKLGRIGKFFLGKDTKMYTLKKPKKVDEAAAVRGVKAQGILNQKQMRQLIINGKARGLMKQAVGFLEKAIKLECPESKKSLDHLQQAMSVLDDVCDD